MPSRSMLMCFTPDALLRTFVEDFCARSSAVWDQIIRDSVQVLIVVEPFAMVSRLGRHCSRVLYTRQLVTT